MELPRGNRRIGIKSNMKKIVLTFGIINGIIVSIGMLFTLNSGSINMEKGELFGYSSMIIAFSTIFFGVRAYRNKNSNGSIKFGKAFQNRLIHYFDRIGILCGFLVDNIQYIRSSNYG